VLRSFVAVAAGFAVMALLVMAAYVAFGPRTVIEGEESILPPDRAHLVRMLAIEFVAGLAAGAITTRLARRAPLHHTLVLILVALLFGMFLTITVAGGEPLWMQLAHVVVLALGGYLGGALRLRRPA
jgi:peptidoglycan/LPS O-acetylase OafA/YrhL